MFHKVLLLSEGNPLYFGKGSNALDYFSSVGFVPSVAMDPAGGISPDDSCEDEIAIKQTLVCSYKENLSKSVKSEVGSDHNQLELLFFNCGFLASYPVFQGIFTFSRDRAMLAKERASGMYHLSSYFMALTLGDLPMDLVLPTIFSIITYWMAGLNPTPESFFSGLFVLLYSMLCSKGLGLAIGAMIVNMESTTAFGTVFTLTFLQPSGF
ncbi:hypothetical protein RD792_003452 [Penstemon davidsonii]|uniref:ABC-2 type transporter transmembrane domain-containing protein n=1 Tax=Penstemon davidsonii TaxID=160366 RepID=A0ABR0DTS6_9LAMI|nr:hypothetical protein RD792_003452 [Penstemon davidsonii]